MAKIQDSLADPGVLIAGSGVDVDQPAPGDPVTISVTGAAYSDAFPAAGLESARPTSGLPIPAFYSATDTGVVYRSADGGATWAVWALALPEGTTDGDVPVWDDTAGLWVPGAPSVGGGGGPAILATAEATTSATASTSTTVDADVNSQMAVTYEYPASGVVLVESEALYDASATINWTLRRGSTTVVENTLGSAGYRRARATFKVTGTPGATDTLKLGHHRLGGSGTGTFYTGGNGGSAGNGFMRVLEWA